VTFSGSLIQCAKKGGTLYQPDTRQHR